MMEIKRPQFKSIEGRYYGYVTNEQGCHLVGNENNYVQVHYECKTNVYGDFNDRKARYEIKRRYLHRMAYEEQYPQTLHTGRRLTHTCGNKNCINAEHMKLLHNEETNGNAKINADIAKAIYTAEGTYEELTVKFDVSRATVANIKGGKAWANATKGLTKPMVKRGRRVNVG
jgi:hypothetical protein